MIDAFKTNGTSPPTRGEALAAIGALTAHFGIPTPQFRWSSQSWGARSRWWKYPSQATPQRTTVMISSRQSRATTLGYIVHEVAHLVTFYRDSVHEHHNEKFYARLVEVATVVYGRPHGYFETATEYARIRQWAHKDGYLQRGEENHG